MNTANLTPYYESVIVARKPCEGSCIDNVLQYGVGGINIDECRIPTDDYLYNHGNSHGTVNSFSVGNFGKAIKGENASTALGRFPSNIILTYDDTDKEEVCGGMPDTKGAIRTPTGGTILNPNDGWNNNSMTDTTIRGFDDDGSAARYFYNAKETERDDEQITYEVNTMENQEEQKIHLYSEGKSYKLYQGNMLDMLDVIEPNSIDAIVTDPPYELGFMNKGWDNSGVAFQKETWEKCLKVLKPGGYLLAFGGSRTSHRIACAIEDAGFEIRDTILWLYGSGFPKSMNIGLAIDKKEGVQGQRGIGGFNVGGIQEQENRKAKLYIGSTTDGSKQAAYTDYKSEEAKKWAGWGTCLKPAYEPIIISRKPFDGSCIDNVLTYGTGGINIDECRVGDEKLVNNGMSSLGVMHDDNWRSDKSVVSEVNGRFPANVILTYDETDKEEVCGGMPYTENNTKSHLAKNSDNNVNFNASNIVNVIGYEDNGSAARYFYCAKASKRDRDEGCENLEDKTLAMSNQAKAELKRGNTDFTGDPTSPLNAFNTVQVAKNNHPTVKPCDLMQYLIRLVTPKGGTILDPFNGSGSTGKAAMFENKDRNANYKYIGIELTPEYLPISKARIEYAINYVDVIQEKPMSVEKKKMLNNQISLFDLPQ